MEEDIKKIEYFLNQADEYYDGNIDIKDCVITKEVAEAIENLIARNKEWEDKYRSLQNSEAIKQTYIPKSKVREKIEELDIEHLKDRIDITIEPCSYFYMAIEMAQNKLKELLQEGDK